MKDFIRRYLPKRFRKEGVTAGTWAKEEFGSDVLAVMVKLSKGSFKPTAE